MSQVQTAGISSIIIQNLRYFTDTPRAIQTGTTSIFRQINLIFLFFNWVQRDDYLFQSLYRESSIPLPGSPLHNHHINICDPLEDGLMTRPFDVANASQSKEHLVKRLDHFTRYYFNQYSISTEKVHVQFPSKLYVFKNLRANLIYDIKSRQKEEKLSECAIEILQPDPLVAKSVLSTCHKISQYQSVTDFVIDGTYCQDMTASEAPIMSKNFRALSRVFRKLTILTIMTILATEALLREKNPVTKCYPSIRD